MFFAVLATISFSLVTSASTMKSSKNELTISKIELVNKKLKSHNFSITDVKYQGNYVCGFTLTLDNGDGAPFSGYVDCTGWDSDTLWNYLMDLLNSNW